MSTDISSSFSSRHRPECRRGVARLGLCAALVLAALGGGCAEDPPADVATNPVPDAGPACDPGTLGCTCPCQTALLCIAGRCLATEGPREPETQLPPRPRPAPPPPSILDAGSEPASSDAGPGASGGPDAAAPDASDASS